MSAQPGRDLLLKVDSNGAQNFVTIAGLRSKTIALNSATIDVTDAESPGQWRELLEGGGVRRAHVSGTGLFKDATSDETVRGLFFAGTIRDWQIVIPDFGTLTAPFQISALEYGGTHQGEVTFDIALESAGQISFAAA